MFRIRKPILGDAWRRGFMPVLLMCGLLPATTAMGQEMPKVGDQAKDFVLKTYEDKEVRLSEALAKGPVVLLVLRGNPGYQCPICSRQVGQFLAAEEQLRSKQATVLMVYPGPQAQLDVKAREFLRGNDLPDRFHLLIDPEYHFTSQWHLRWDEPRETAYPSTFLIGKDGVIQFAKISRTHGDRAEVSAVLKALQN